MPDFDLEKISDFTALENRWQEVENNADASFFQSWTFLGCLAAERFAGASLLAVRNGDTDLALALIGQAGKRGFFNETGDPDNDAIFIEHNALLTRRGVAGVIEPALRHAISRLTNLRLSGISEAMLQAAAEAGRLRLRQKRAAPFANLHPHNDPLAAASANLRAQINRSHRLFGADVALEPAQDLDQALEFFAELVAAHQHAWRARGKPGAFASDSMRRFHAALINRAWPRGEVDLLRVAAGRRQIGFLYNFVKEGRVSAYQSGFVYSGDNREKPGLLCHAMALRHYAERGCATYDFLAGADRYKLSFTQASEPLFWAELYPRWSVSGMMAASLDTLRRLRNDTPAAPRNASK
jgi:CelD/BcsL family acetyltransferase involved in cellulose biosynthesis